MVNAKDRTLIENLVQRLVEGVGARKIAAEWLLDDQPRALVAAGRGSCVTTIGNMLGGMAR